MDSRKDMAFAIVIAVFGLFVAAAAYRFPPPLVPDAIGPRAFPIGLGLLLLVGGAAIALRSFLARNAAGGYVVAAEGSEDDPAHPASGLRGIALIALVFLYAFLLQPVGFILATPPAVGGALALLGERSPVLVIGAAVVFTAVIYLLFAVVLGVRMPLGPLTFLAR